MSTVEDIERAIEHLNPQDVTRLTAWLLKRDNGDQKVEEDSAAGRVLDSELSRTVLELSLEDRLELARRLVESAIQPAHVTEAVKEGIGRIEDVAAGRIVGLTERQYRGVVR